MGTDIHVAVVGRDAGLVARAETRIRALDATWSRFCPDSELSRLNRACGRPTIVSPDTCDVIARAVQAWQLTGGRFDPTVHAGLVSSGYDRSFELMDPDDPVRVPRPQPAPGCGGVEVDHSTGMVIVPVGVTLDLGGIGKGAAADLVADELMADGADGVCINIGGDVRVCGMPPDDTAWRIGIDCPGGAGDTDRTVALLDGAVCTSTRLKRRWRTDRGTTHHLLDPATGEATASGLSSVTVIAAEASVAEVLTKTVFVAGAQIGASILRDVGATGLVVDDAGCLSTVDGYQAYAA